MIDIFIEASIIYMAKRTQRYRICREQCNDLTLVTMWRRIKTIYENMIIQRKRMKTPTIR